MDVGDRGAPVSFPVLWFMPDVEREPDASPTRLTWDQYQVERTLSDLGGVHAVWGDGDLPDAAVVVIPCGRYEPDFVQAELDRLNACVVVLTSDETALFDSSKLHHRNARWWVADPRPGRVYPEGARFLPCGFPPYTSETLANLGWSASCRENDWAFLGQVNHRHRERMVAVLDRLPGGDLRPTHRFATGVSQTSYLRAMANAKVAPCPSGPGMCDSFRVWEALEAGCLPVVEQGCPAYDAGFWDQLGVPFPTVADWGEFPELLPGLLAGWPANANRVQAWWSQYKRAAKWGLWDDWNAVTGGDGLPYGNVTVLIPTSPIPSHPDTGVIEQTVASVRHHLPDAELIVMCDGVRPEMEYRRANYDEYTRRLSWLVAHEWGRCTMLVFDELNHQVAMTKAAFNLVRTPLILFVEHDAPLVTDEMIDWPACEQAVLSSSLHTIRFHFEGSIPEPHRHLMIDKVPTEVGGVSVIRTKQWSSRPHLTSTDWFRAAGELWFTPEACTFWEDRLHGAVQDEPWFKSRLAIYAPGDGTNLKRSDNLDGRQGDPKFDDQLVF